MGTKLGSWVEPRAKKIWHFLWEEESVWSWLANILVAFVLIKFIVYPGLGLLLGTSYPIVAVVSGSMEHHTGFDDWWAQQGLLYESYGITPEDFKAYPFSNGFNKGDIMLLRGIKKDNIKKGMVIVFRSQALAEPIIHRVIAVDNGNNSTDEKNNGITRAVTTKGDFNKMSHAFEHTITPDHIIGQAFIKIPYLGYIKIWFVELLKSIGIQQ